MKATKEQAEKHLEGLRKRNPTFIGGVVFCESANEWVVECEVDKLHLHATDWVDELEDWEKEIFAEDKQ